MLSIRGLTESAVQSTSGEFLRLIKVVVHLLSQESERIGNIRVKGRLGILSSQGEAIVIGDLHGDLKSLEYILKKSAFIEKVCCGEEVFLIFLGDYGDRGLHSLEVYYVILRLKELFPERVLLIRGNHEGPNDLLAQPHDLPKDLYQKFRNEWSTIYRNLRELFTFLYNAVIIDQRYVLLHGGVPSCACTRDDLGYAHRKHPQESHFEEMLWSDPVEDLGGTHPSPRGVGKLFGQDVTERVLKRLCVEVLIRGHEPCREGYKLNHNGKVITLFSRKGTPYYNTRGAYIHLDLLQKLKSVEKLSSYIQQF